MSPARRFVALLSYQDTPAARLTRLFFLGEGN